MNEFECAESDELKLELDERLASEVVDGFEATDGVFTEISEAEEAELSKFCELADAKTKSRVRQFPMTFD